MTEKAISRYKPKIIVLIGIAGGLETDLSLGDVVVADEINEFLMDSKAVSHDGTYVLKLSGSHWDIPDDLVSLARNFRPTHPDLFERWQTDASNYRNQKMIRLSRQQKHYVKKIPKVYVGHIASDNTVGASQVYSEINFRRGS